MKLSDGTENFCKGCRWYRKVDGEVGKCAEPSRCSVDSITDYRLKTQSCYKWMPKLGFTVSTGTEDWEDTK